VNQGLVQRSRRASKVTSISILCCTPRIRALTDNYFKAAKSYLEVIPRPGQTQGDRPRKRRTAEEFRRRINWPLAMVLVISCQLKQLNLLYANLLKVNTANQKEPCRATLAQPTKAQDKMHPIPIVI
jgi:hypothetical protein